MKILRSPFNYTGSKYKLMPKINELLPEKIVHFEDWFCGSGVVFNNLAKPPQVILANDAVHSVVGMLVQMGMTPPDDFINGVSALMIAGGLGRNKPEAYYKFRDNFNRGVYNEDAYMHALYALIAHAYNNIWRFNAKGEFNAPFGKRTFNDKMQENLREYIARLHAHENLVYLNWDFMSLPTDHLQDDDLVFADPPYAGGDAVYNGRWDAARETALLKKLDGLNCKFMLTSATVIKGTPNAILIEWLKSHPHYNVVNLGDTFSGSYRATRGNGGETNEVIVMNY